MRAAVLTLLAALALALAGCGGGSDEGGSEVDPPDTATETSQRPSSAAGGDRSGSRGKEEEPAPGGEASIEGFGSEATGDERSSIEGTFRSYMSAVAEQDYGTACSYLSATVQRSLEQLVVKELKGKGCVGILPKLLAPTAPAIAREQANGDITKVRVEGDRGFVVFHAPGAELYQQTMVREGEWKVATVAASVLVPSL